MYPVSLGYDEAINRVRSLLKNGHHAEALVVSMFTVEKTLRRTLRQIVVSAGFSSNHAEKIVRNCRGLEALKHAWELYDPNNKKLSEVVSDKDWKLLMAAAEMRNKMVHGERVYKLEICKRETNNILAALQHLKSSFDRRYGFDGWRRLTIRRKHRLHCDPSVKI